MRFALGLLLAGAAVAQDIAALAAQPAIKAALDRVRANEAATIEEQVRICEIPAPPFMEERRGRELERLYREAGLADVRTDKVGNVIGVFRGAAAHPNLVFATHLDTVFGPEVDVKVKREGGKYKGPGIADNCRGLAVELAVIRALIAEKVSFPGTVTFVANVGEEGLGDLRGMKELFDNTIKGQADRFITLDNGGLGLNNTGVGSYRYRVSVSGPGGHSFSAFGMANPVHALGRAIAKIDAIQVPSNPKTTFNVGRIGGGTSVNSIAEEAWMEIDMRSSDKDSLETIRSKIEIAVKDAVREENERWDPKNPVALKMDLVGLRPAGITPLTDPIVRAAVAVTKYLGEEAPPGENSNDSNYPRSLGIPSIGMGGGGNATGGHSESETWDPTDSWKGTQRVLLLIAALAR